MLQVSVACVQVFEHQEQGLHLTFAEQDALQGLQGAAAPLQGIQGQEGMVGWQGFEQGKHGWHRFLNSVNLVLPKRGKTLDVPNEIGQPLAF